MQILDYRSSAKVCVGYEMGWKFVTEVLKSHQTFTGFCDTIKSMYTISGSKASNEMILAHVQVDGSES